MELNGKLVSLYNSSTAPATVIELGFTYATVKMGRRKTTIDLYEQFNSLVRRPAHQDDSFVLRWAILDNNAFRVISIPHCSFVIINT